MEAIRPAAISIRTAVAQPDCRRASSKYRVAILLLLGERQPVESAAAIRLAG
jgi:hypothetical protein